MKNTSILILVTILFNFLAKAQELNIPNNHLADNQYLMSSAFAGIGDCFQVRASGLQQWLGIENAPNTQSISIDGRLTDNIGLGSILFNDSNGLTKHRGGKLSYAHHLTLNPYTKQYLSFGVSYRLSQFVIETSEFNQEAVANVNGVNETNHNMDLSMLFRYHRWFFNINADNLLSKSISAFNESEPESTRSFSAYTGITFHNKYANRDIEPSMMYQFYTEDGRSAFDVNLKYRKYKEKDYIWLGIASRFFPDQGFNYGAITPMFGLNTKQFYVSYGLQVFLNEFSGIQQAGTHMLSVGFDFKCIPSNCGCTLLNPDEEDFYKF